MKPDANTLRQPRPVTLVRSSYQPSKADLEEPIDLQKADGSRPTMDELADAVLSPVEVRYKDRP